MVDVDFAEVAISDLARICLHAEEISILIPNATEEVDISRATIDDR
jgi:hypothetical protein